MKVCIVIIFNHRYDQNIELIRKLYGKRFECIRILMPFYDGDDKCVIPVYECSYQFQGYLIQAYDRLMETGASYFFFVSDDVMIHPAIDQNNLIDVFQMRGRDVFFDKMFCLIQKVASESGYIAGILLGLFYINPLNGRGVFPILTRQ